MANKSDILKQVEGALSQALDGRLSKLRELVTQEVLQVVAPSMVPGSKSSDALNTAVSAIYDATAQTDILKALLDGLGQFTERAALFVHKAGNLIGWQSRGFSDDASIRGVSIGANEGLAARVITSKEVRAAAASDFDSTFIATHGNPHDGNAVLIPLVVREKVAAVIYTDAGLEAGGKADQAAVKVLVRSAASWLEIIALRKSGAPAEAVAAPEAASSPVEDATVAAQADAAQEQTVAAEPDLSAFSPEDQEVHKKARRFARLLVDEIKLYNQKKVDEGRQNRDLYHRLKEDIDKSRATYEKRYGATSAASAGYFSEEVVRILADNDAGVMGNGFPR